MEKYTRPFFFRLANNFSRLDYERTVPGYPFEIPDSRSSKVRIKSLDLICLEDFIYCLSKKIAKNPLIDFYKKYFEWYLQNCSNYETDLVKNKGVVTETKFIGELELERFLSFLKSEQLFEDIDLKKEFNYLPIPEDFELVDPDGDLKPSRLVKSIFEKTQELEGIKIKKSRRVRIFEEHSTIYISHLYEDIYKIGYSNSPLARSKDFSREVGMPVKLIYASVPFTEGYFIEQTILKYTEEFLFEDFVYSRNPFNRPRELRKLSQDKILELMSILETLAFCEHCFI